MWHKPCRTFHPWCPCIKTRCLFAIDMQPSLYIIFLIFSWLNTFHVYCISLDCNGSKCSDVSLDNQYHDVIMPRECFPHYWPFGRETVDYPLQWRHNDHDGVSNHQPHGCLLDRLFRCKSKKTSKLRVTGLCVGNSPGPVNSPHKWPVRRKMILFDDVIMHWIFLTKIQ